MEGNFNKPPASMSLEERRKSFGALLGKQRNKLNKSARIIAELIPEKNHTTLQRWESGEAFPKPEKLEAIAVAYGFDRKQHEQLLQAFKDSREAHDIFQASLKSVRK
jgi:transcriptional regulator with XRE-family HTH domain